MARQAVRQHWGGEAGTKRVEEKMVEVTLEGLMREEIAVVIREATAD